MPPRIPPTHRTLEIVGIAAAAALSTLVLLRLAGAEHAARGWLLLAGAAFGYVAADLLSGFVHWVFDTWGTERTPVIGRSFIQPFREHHTDPMSITRHGFIETNGNNCIATLPVLIAACVIGVTTPTGILAVASLVSLSLGILATNQIHRWAHADDPGPIVRFLQRCRLILPPEHHRMHHAAPYATHYCITTGWFDAMLAKIRFHRRAEAVITAMTGVRPR